MRKKISVVALLGLCILSARALDVCEEQPNGARLSHPADCGKFVVCEDGQTALISACPIGLHFNRQTAECDFKNRAGCEMMIPLPSSADSADNCDCSCCSCCCCNGECGSGSTTGSTSASTSAPDSTSASTSAPDSTPAPTTPAPTTPAPTTPAPTTPAPTTPAPTTPAPTTPAPTTPAPTTPAPTTPPPNCNTPPGVVPPPGCPSGPATGPSGVSCVNNGVCAGKPDGTLFANSGTNGYIVCQCECEIAMPCPEGLVFNTVVNVCDWPAGSEGGGSGSGGSGSGGSGSGGSGSGGSGSGGSGSGGSGSGGSGSGGSGSGGGESGGSGSGGSGSGGGESGGSGSGGSGSGGSGSGGSGSGGSGSGGSGSGGSGSGGSGGSDVGCSNDSTLCKDQPDGTLFPVDGVCNQFYKCNFGCAVELNCPNNLVYNSKGEYCDYPQNYKCPWPYTPPSGPSAGPSGIACPSGGRCVGQREGTFFPSTNSCGKYVVCQCECEVEMECSVGLYFDPTNNVCNYPDQVSCSL